MRFFAFACFVLFVLFVLSCSPADESRTGSVGAPSLNISDSSGSAAAGVLDEQSAPLILRVTEKFMGDLAAIQKRGVLRVLVTHNRTNFFLAKGRVRGFEYEMFRELEKKSTFKVAFIPVPFSELIPALLRGHGDVAASALTVTPERSAQVAFTQPYRPNVFEILVAHKDAPAITSWTQLAGERIHVVAGTSYIGHLKDINKALVARKLDPLRIEISKRGLATEDMLEMVNSGAFRYTVADQYLAELWAKALPDVRLFPNVVAAQSGGLAWAVRPNNPKLRAMLDRYAADNRTGTLMGNILFKRYYATTKWIKNPLFDVDRSRAAPYLPVLKKYCKQYNFDWRLIAAQAYQESQFRADAVSHSGAVGLMQLMAPTAKDMGCKDRRDPDENLKAGIKYMHWLRKNYFSDDAISPPAQVDFALAAYNCGPGRVRQLRRKARERGMDANTWFGSVETIALEVVGREPVTYVANINKYFIIFSLLLDEMEARDE